MTIAPILMHHQITNTFNSKGNHAGHEITWKYPPYPWLFSTLQPFWEFFQTCIKPQHSASIPRWNKTLWRKLNLHVSHFCRTNSPTFISNENHHIHRSILPFSQKFTKIYIKQKSSPSMHLFILFHFSESEFLLKLHFWHNGPRPNWSGHIWGTHWKS